MLDTNARAEFSAFFKALVQGGAKIAFLSLDLLYKSYIRSFAGFVIFSGQEKP